MTKELKCKDCIFFEPVYPPMEIVFPYGSQDVYRYTSDGKCRCISPWFCTNSEEYCSFPTYIGEEKSVEDEELTYEFLRCEAEGRDTNEIFTSRDVSGRTLDGSNG